MAAEDETLAYHERMEGERPEVRTPNGWVDVAELLAKAWDEGAASANGYDLNYHLDREEWLAEVADPAANPYRVIRDD